MHIGVGLKLKQILVISKLLGYHFWLVFMPGQVVVVGTPISVTRLGIFWTLGNFLKPLSTINLPKSPTFLGIFSNGVKIYYFSSEIIFGQLL